MSKPGFRNLKEVMASLRQKVSVPWNQAELNEIGKKARDLIVNSVRSGKNPKLDKPLKELTSEAWIKERESIALSNDRSDVYSKRRSNLSLTGEFLESIIYEAKPSDQKISIRPEGIHEPYASPGSSSRPMGSPVENSTILKGQKNQGRDILGLSERLNKQIITLMRRLYRKKITEAKARLGFK